MSSFLSRTRLALACFALLLAGCASSTSVTEKKGGKTSKQVGRPMPPLEMSSLDGKRNFTLASLRGKVVLLDIWASWCAPCKEELPLLNEMADRLKKKGIEIVAVSIDEDRASAEAFLTSRKRWSLTFAHDPEGKIPTLLKPPKMPTSYIIDSQGILRHVNEGFDRADIAPMEKKLLALAEES